MHLFAKEELASHLPFFFPSLQVLRDFISLQSVEVVVVVMMVVLVVVVVVVVVVLVVVVVAMVVVVTVGVVVVAVGHSMLLHIL